MNTQTEYQRLRAKRGLDSEEIRRLAFLMEQRERILTNALYARLVVIGQHKQTCIAKENYSQLNSPARVTWEALDSEAFEVMQWLRELGKPV